MKRYRKELYHAFVA